MISVVDELMQDRSYWINYIEEGQSKLDELLHEFDISSKEEEEGEVCAATQLIEALVPEESREELNSVSSQESEEATEVDGETSDNIIPKTEKWLDLMFGLNEIQTSSRICEFLMADESDKVSIALAKLMEGAQVDSKFIYYFLNIGGIPLLLTKFAIDDEKLICEVSAVLEMLTTCQNVKYVITEINSNEGIMLIRNSLNSSSTVVQHNIISLLHCLFQFRTLQENIQATCFRRIVEKIIDPELALLIKVTKDIVVQNESLLMESMCLIRALTSFSVGLRFQEMRDCGDLFYNIFNIVHNALARGQLQDKFVKTCLFVLTNLVPKARNNDEKPRGFNSFIGDSVFYIEPYCDIPPTPGVHSCHRTRTSLQAEQEDDILKYMGGELVRHAPTPRLLCRVLSKLKPDDGEVVAQRVLESILSLVYGSSKTADQARQVVVDVHVIMKIVSFLHDPHGRVNDLVVLILKSVSLETHKEHVAQFALQPALKAAFNERGMRQLNSLTIIGILDLLDHLLKDSMKRLTLFELEGGVERLALFLNESRKTKTSDTWLVRRVEKFLKTNFSSRRFAAAVRFRSTKRRNLKPSIFPDY